MNAYKYLQTPCNSPDVIQRLFFEWFNMLRIRIYLFQIDCHTKFNVSRFSYYLLLAGRRKLRCIPFSNIFLAAWEVKTASFRFRTHVTVLVSFSNNHNTTSTSSLYLQKYQNQFTENSINDPCTIFETLLKLIAYNYNCRDYVKSLTVMDKVSYYLGRLSWLCLLQVNEHKFPVSFFYVFKT